MFRPLLIAASLFACAGTLHAQEIDVQHYVFGLKLSDASDRVEGHTVVTLNDQGLKQFSLDLVQVKGNGKGMTVSAVSGADVAGWEQRDDKLIVKLAPVKEGPAVRQVDIRYGGVPADGLIISKNKWGERTFFADNWPNRAHHWIPCNDRPDDKATFEFLVEAPKHYRVVSNGEEKPVPAQAGGGIVKPDPNMMLTHWSEPVAQPTKVMVIGAARFAVKTFSDSPAGIPVSAWVYPQDSTKGFYDYALAPSIVKFFSDYIAPFPYTKLANVQSKTIFGGMENASAIFYAEESVTGDRKWEDVIAHEIAHQWFGDMASEKSFAHLWLSEGFATYFTNLWIEHKYGADSMRKRLLADRRQVADFVKSSKSAVVDSTKNLMSLLNANSYQKGGWVLHMLRREVGDSAFRQIIRTYYQTYKGKNAETRDFQRVADSVYSALVPQRSTPSLNWFFDQWLYRPGIPILDVTEKKVDGKVRQVLVQEGPLYTFTMEIAVVSGDGQRRIYPFRITERETELVIENDPPRNRMIFDPNFNLLYRGAKDGQTYWRPRSN